MSEPAPAERSWLPFAALGFVAAFIIPAFTAGAYAAVTGDTSGLGAVLAAQTGFWAGLAGAAYLAGRASRPDDPWGALGFSFRRVDAGVGLAVGVASQLILVPLVEAPVRWLEPHLSQKLDRITNDVFRGTTGGRYAAFATVIVLGAGFVEELYFRGLLQAAVTRRAGPVWGVAVASVVFGVSHFHLLELPALVAFGVVLGLLVQRTGRLGPAIVAHLAFDGLATIQFAVSHHLF